MKTAVVRLDNQGNCGEDSKNEADEAAHDAADDDGPLLFS